MHIFWKIKEFRFQFVEWFSENEHVCGYEAVDFCVCVCGGGGGGSLQSWNHLVVIYMYFRVFSQDPGRNWNTFEGFLIYNISLYA